MTSTLSHKSTDEKCKFGLKGYSDAALGKISDPYHGRLWFIISRRYEDIVHPPHRGAHKLFRAAFGSATAKTLVAAESTEVSLYLLNLLKLFNYTHSAAIITDYKAAFEVITSV